MIVSGFKIKEGQCMTCIVEGLAMTPPENLVVPGSFYVDGKTYKTNCIGRYAFYGCKGVKSIELPDSVVSIGTYAFCDMTDLQRVRLPKNLFLLDFMVFARCVNLRKIELPERLGRLECNCFSGCTHLEEINIPKTVTKVHLASFEECVSLKNVILPTDSDPKLVAKIRKIMRRMNLPDGVTIQERKDDSLKKAMFEAALEQFVAKNPELGAKVTIEKYTHYKYELRVQIGAVAYVYNIRNNSAVNYIKQIERIKDFIAETKAKFEHIDGEDIKYIIKGNTLIYANVNPIMVPNGVEKIVKNLISSIPANLEIYLPESVNDIQLMIHSMWFKYANIYLKVGGKNFLALKKELEKEYVIWRGY